MLLAACGGGGSSGPNLSTAPGLTVSPASLSFAAVHNGAIPPAQSIQITLSRSDIAYVVVSYLATPTLPTWLTQSPSLTCSGPNCTLTGGPITTSLATGTYTTTVRIAIQDIGHNVLAFRDVPVSYTITAVPIAASPNLLNFGYAMGGAAPAPQTVTLMGDPAPWTASANQPWIGITPGSGPGGGSVSVSVNPTGLDPNTYNGTVTFTAAGNTATVNVSLSVAAPAIQTSPDSLTFSGVNGATLASQSLNIGMNNGAALNWTATTPLADTWLVLNRTTGTASDPLGVSVNPANGTLASGTYNSSISLQASSGGSSFNKTVGVTMTLTKATLTANPASVTLGGSNGRDFSGVPVQLSLNTGTTSFTWNSNGSSSFVQRTPSSGTVSATPVSVTLTPDATGLSGGTHTGSAVFTAQVNGDLVTLSVPVTFNQESHKLLVDGNGVAFAKTPTLSKLTQTLKVRDNLGLATSWAAAKDQSWLTVIASGTPGGDLVLTADPTGLATDNLYLATVTITSSDPSVENTEKVRVGLWVGSADPSPTTTITGPTFTQIAADPIRPYAYVAVGTDVQIINVHTGLALPSISNVAAQVGPMTVSHDGSTLYAVDTINLKIVPVDLTATPPTKGTPFSASLLSFVKVIDYTRTNGVELIISGSGGQIFDARTGALFPSTFIGNVAVGASRGGSRFCTVDVGDNGVLISCPSLDFTSLNGGQLLLGSTGTASAQGVNAADIAVSADGTVAYVASGTNNGIIAVRKYSTQDLSFLGGFATAGLVNNVEVAADGRIFGASENVFTFGDPDVWVFTAAGTLLTTRELAPLSASNILARQMKVSGDGLRLIVLTADLPPATPSLIFNTVAP